MQRGSHQRRNYWELVFYGLSAGFLRWGQKYDSIISFAGSSGSSPPCPFFFSLSLSLSLIQRSLSFFPPVSVSPSVRPARRLLQIAAAIVLGSAYSISGMIHLFPGYNVFRVSSPSALAPPFYFLHLSVFPLHLSPFLLSFFSSPTALHVPSSPSPPRVSLRACITTKFQLSRPYFPSPIN